MNELIFEKKDNKEKLNQHEKKLIYDKHSFFLPSFSFLDFDLGDGGSWKSSSSSNWFGTENMKFISVNKQSIRKRV